MGQTYMHKLGSPEKKKRQAALNVAIVQVWGGQTSVCVSRKPDSLEVLHWTILTHLLVNEPKGFFVFFRLGFDLNVNKHIS
jgi:hypothetical protein